MELTWEQLQELMDRFEKASFSELDLETEKLKLHLKKEDQKIWTTLPMPEEKEAEAEICRKEQVAEEPAKGAEGLRSIKAPLVGTFYAAPEPGAEPYVKEGQKVKAGETIGLIEAMKVMNEIPSPCDGLVKELLVENGDFVAYDQPLLYLDENVEDLPVK